MMFGQDHNKLIAHLAQLFPKAFFINPRQRRPLKSNIILDIERAADPSLAEFNVGAAVDWYTSHIGYDHACAQAGAERVDLDGKVVGKITAMEAREARARIVSKGREITERRNG